MNKTKLIWGLICLGLAGALVVLNLTQPPEDLMFMVSDINMPWVPPVVLGIAGIALLASAGSAGQAQPEEKQPLLVKDPEKVALNKRLETIAWGCFLVMLGGFLLVPSATIPKGVWSIGVGLIMLGLNAARYFNKIKMSGFTTVLGILSLLGGIAELFGITSLQGGMLLIILGAYLILKPWIEQGQLFGKAEQS